MSKSLPIKTFSYRPQRYHAFDVAETSPRVTFSIEGEASQTFPLLNFSEEGLCFESSFRHSRIKAGDLITSLQIIFGHQTTLTSKAKIKHVTFHKDSQKWHYGIRLLEERLNIPEIFNLRNQAQTYSSALDRLRRIQRAHRYERDFLDQFEIKAHFQWQGRLVSIRIENVSEFGFCFSLSALAEMEIFVGSLLQPETILEEFCFLVDDRPLYDGRVKLTRIKKEVDRLEAGAFCLDGKSVLISGFETAMKLRDAKKEFLLFLDTTAQSEKIHPEFKIALNDFRYFLESMKEYFERVDKDIQNLAEAREKEMTLRAIMHFSKYSLVNQLSTLVQNLEKVILKLNKEENEIHRRYFQEQILDLTNGSIVFRRALEKPLGYPGDYEIMNMIYHHSNDGDTLWERMINSCLNSLEATEAVRNRAGYLEKKITQTVSTLADRKEIHILSLACGPCEEIQRYIKSTLGAERPQLHFYLLDQDEQALTYAQKQLYSLAYQSSSNRMTFKFLKQGVKHLLEHPELVSSYPPMDLIYSAGLFDYLPTPVAKNLTTKLLSMLSEGGLLIIGNFNKAYHGKFMEEYACEWFLIHRSSEDMLNFLPNDSFKASSIVEKELTGINLFLNVKKTSPC